MGATKNLLSMEKIKKVAVKAFPKKEIVKAEELTEGLCNAAYLIEFSDGIKTILKIAPRDKRTLLSNEVHIFLWKSWKGKVTFRVSQN